MYDHIKAEDSEVYSAIMQEIGRQRNKIELIACSTRSCRFSFDKQVCRGLPGKALLRRM